MKNKIPNLTLLKPLRMLLSRIFAFCKELYSIEYAMQNAI